MPEFNESTMARLLAARTVILVIVVALACGAAVSRFGTSETSRVAVAAAASGTSVRASNGLPAIVVDVAGEVKRPGVYEFTHGARVGDAIWKAGGFRRTADIASVNRAAELVDGQQLVVAPRVPPSREASSLRSSVRSTPSINSASAEQFDELPGIGPVTAADIVADRTTNGPFASVDELDRVPGVGPATIDKLRDIVTL